MRIDLRPALESAGAFDLGLPSVPVRGMPGDHLSRGVGSSVEFQDFRPYVPGDDPRHIDWNAVARTDQLIVRLHREEVRLAVDILLDGSRSLAIGNGAKAERGAQAAYLFALLARRKAARTGVWWMGGRAERWSDSIEERLSAAEFGGVRSLAEVLGGSDARLTPGSLRIVISDFLFPFDPGALFLRIAKGAGAVAMLQVLLPEEVSPPEGGHARLVDVETGEERPVAMSREIVQAYRTRLGMLQEGLRTACRAHRAPFAALSAGEGLAGWCRGPLSEAGVVRPR